MTRSVILSERSESKDPPPFPAVSSRPGSLVGSASRDDGASSPLHTEQTQKQTAKDLPHGRSFAIKKEQIGPESA